MATSEQYAEWIVKNADKKGTPDFEIVAKAYQDSKAKTDPVALTEAPVEDKSYLQKVGSNIGDEIAGVVRGAGSIGNSIVTANEKLNEYAPQLASVIPGSSILSKVSNYFVPEAQGQTISGLVSGKKPLTNYERRAQGMDQGLQSFGADPESNFFKGGKIYGEVAGTGGVGEAIAPLAAASKFTAPLAEMIRTGGTGPSVVSGKGVIPSVKSLSMRALGGGITGAASTAAIDPSQAKTGFTIGAALPSAFKVAGSLGKGASAMAAPFTEVGQKYTIGSLLNDFSHNPSQALQNLKSAPDAYPSGALPTTAEASGDIGLTGLTRGMANKPDFSNLLATRSAAQNASRSQMIGEISGNPGKISAAEIARNDATAELREKALNEAGNIPVHNISSKIDSLLSDPDNDRKFAQQALKEYKSRVDKYGDEIPAKALYAIRKDINDTLEGKLQGDEGNIKQAAAQLRTVKKIFDDAIESSINKPAGKELAIRPRTGTALVDLAMQGGQKTEFPATNSFKQYLKTYSDMSKPIDQMDAIQTIFKRIQNGTEDAGGNLVLSSAKLNNIMKNEGEELRKTLTSDQLNVLRNLSAELNASQKGLNSGKPVGSNTIQNYNIDKSINSMLEDVGLSTIGKTALGGLSKLALSRANDDLMQQLGETLLDPKRAARLMEEANKTNMSAQKLADFVKLSSRSSIAELSASQGKK